MKRLAWLLSMGCVVTELLAQSSAPPQGLTGELPERTTWRGRVRIDGDVTVPKGGRLEIAAGTVVSIAARDRSSAGWHPDRVEIHVHGQLLVEGNLEQPVVFVPDDGQGEGLAEATASWHGIVLHPRADATERRTMIHGIQLWRAFAGIQIPEGQALVEDGVFLACLEGMEIGAAYKDARFYGHPGGVAAPEVRRCRFVGCTTGIFTQLQARPQVEFCVFSACGTGIGANRPGIHSVQGRPGPRVLGCAFVDVTDAVYGCAVVRESWFLRCRRAMRLSAFHDRLATTIEPVVFEGNLVEEVGEVVVGDSGAARTALVGPVAPMGSLEALATPWPPLPDCLRLGTASAGKGRGPGGRDLGPLGGTGPAVASAEIVWNGALTRGWLAAPVDAVDARRVPPVALGAKVGSRWWAVADTDEQGVLHLRGVFGLGRTGGLLALPFTMERPGRLRLPWTGDTASLEVLLDGRSVFQLAARRRFGAEEAPIELDCAAGKHVLLVRIEGWGSDPRWALGKVDGWQLTAPVAPREVSMKAQVKRSQRSVHVEVKPSVAVHWRMAPGVDAVELRDATGARFTVDWEWTDAGLLRLRPAAETPGKQDLRLVWKGVRDLAGQVLAIEPTLVRLP
jgi:hypothetical protein